MRLKSYTPYHHFIFGLTPALSLFATNKNELLWTELIYPCSIIIITVIITWFVLSKILRNSLKAACTVSLFLILFFSYGQFHAMIKDCVIGDFHIGRQRFFFPVWFIAISFIIKEIIRNMHDGKIASRFMNIMSAVLVLPLIVLIIIGSNGIHSDHWKIFADDRGIEVPSAPTNTPDIYYLVFDSYSRSDTLNDRFGFDNSTFLNRLKEKGFFVATKSRSNYDSTFPSMASSLNFFYIDELAKKLGKGYRQTKPLHKLIRHNKAAKVLKRMGYTYVTSSSLGGGDVDLFPGKLFNEFRSILFYETPLPVVLQNLRTVFSIKSIYDRHRAVILSQLEQITEITNIKEPTFTYAHILFPHPPFVFSAKGDFIEPSRAFRLQLGLDLGDREENVKGYVAQIEYANARIEQIVDHILEKSDVDPVIIIQADHGPMLEAAEEDNWYLMERYPILNAYYMPKSLDQLYSDISPVNTFPILFNAYFGTDIPLKKDESYQFKWGDPESFEPIEEFL